MGKSINKVRVTALILGILAIAFAFSPGLSVFLNMLPSISDPIPIRLAVVTFGWICGRETFLNWDSQGGEDMDSQFPPSMVI